MKWVLALAGLAMIAGGLFVIYSANFDLQSSHDMEAPFVIGWGSFFCICCPGLVCLVIAAVVAGKPTKVPHERSEKPPNLVSFFGGAIAPGKARVLLEEKKEWPDGVAEPRGSAPDGGEHQGGVEHD